VNDKLESLKRMKVIKILILLSITGILVITFLFIYYWKEQNQLIKRLKSNHKLAYGKGISFVEYRGDKKVYFVSIDSFSMERARLGPFAIGPLHIAHLDKVNIDLYLDGIESRSEKERMGEKGEEGILDFENPISNIKKNLPLQIKKVKGIKLKDISINLWKNEKRIFRILSDTATVDRETGDIIFTGHANMDANENGKLISHRVRWDRKSHLFKVADPYYFMRDGKKTEGAGIETDYLFQRMNQLVSKH
jgi:hypothetical protein